MIIPRVQAIVNPEYESTDKLTMLELFKAMHFYYVIGDTESANSIREWLIEVAGFTVSIFHDQGFMQIRKGVSSAVYQYSMDDIELSCVSFVGSGKEFQMMVGEY